MDCHRINKMENKKDAKGLILIPAYNEAGGIAAIVSQALAHLPHLTR